jgi:hypothetical protein
MYDSAFRVVSNVLRRLVSGTIRLQALGSSLMRTVLRLSIVLCCAVVSLYTTANCAQAQVAANLTFDNSSSLVNEQGFPNFADYGVDATPTPLPPNIRFDYGGTSTTVGNTSETWSPNDAAGNPNSGSLKLSIPMAYTVDGGNTKGGFTMDVFRNVQQEATLSFDAMVDPASSPEQAGTAAGYGFFQLATRDSGYGFNPISQIGEDIGAAYTGVIAGQWQHFSVTLDPANQNIRGITFQDYGGPGQNIFAPPSAPVIIYLDNITLTPVPEPASLALMGLAIPALVVAAKRRFRSAV